MKPDIEQLSDTLCHVYFQGLAYSIEFYRGAWSILRIGTDPLYSSDSIADCLAWLQANYKVAS